MEYLCGTKCVKIAGVAFNTVSEKYRMQRQETKDFY